MAGSTEHECFSPSGDHHPLPEGLSRFNVFEFPYMMNLKWSLRRFAVFTLAAVQTTDQLRMAEGKRQCVRGDVDVRPAWHRGSEIFESEERENACPVLFRYGQDIPIVAFELAAAFVEALAVFVGQRFEEAGLPDVGQFVHALLHITGQCIVVCQPSQFSVVGKKDFRITEQRQCSS